MSKELIEKCIEYGITGSARTFLENIEEAYNTIAKSEKEYDGFIINMIQWIDENVKNASSELEGFTDQQMFFFGIGVLSNEIMDRLNS